MINFEKIEVQLLGNSFAIIDVRISYSSIFVDKDATFRLSIASAKNMCMTPWSTMV